MKKFSAILSVSLTLIFLWLFGNLLPNIYLENGKKAYEEKDYQKAFKELQNAVRLTPENKDARYYYVQTLLRLPPTLEVQSELFILSQKNLADSADLIADRQISKWRNIITQKSGENFIEQAPFNDQILRWDLTKMPINVAISNNGTSVPDYYFDAIKKAFLEWQAIAGFINFNFVENPTEAQILVKIIPSGQRSKCNENCQYVMAYTVPQINGGILKKMTVSFYDSNNLSQAFSATEVYNTSLHEIGHALGIMGHSFSKDDLMYMQYDGAKNENAELLKNNYGRISEKDLNTLTLLYRLIPDITNTPLSEFNTEKQFFAPVVMGDKKLINSRKVLEAQNYIEKAPGLPNGYIDLASALTEQSEFNSALEALSEALNKSSTDEEKFIANYNIALVFARIEDYQNAIQFAQTSKQYSSQKETDAEINSLLANVYFNQGKLEKSKEILLNLLEENPSSSQDAITLAKIYLREFNYPKAGKTLNRLVSINPAEKNNPEIKPFYVLMFLFK